MSYSKLLIILSLSFVVGCGSSRTSVSTREVTGSVSERVSQVERIFKNAMPSNIEDAQLIEQQIGGGGLGPSDFKSFLWLKVSPDAVDAWRAFCEKKASPPAEYCSPPVAVDWWLAEPKFESLDKLDAWRMFGRHGWIVLDDDGNIYAMTFTT